MADGFHRGSEFETKQFSAMSFIIPTGILFVSHFFFYIVCSPAMLDYHFCFNYLLAGSVENSCDPGMFASVDCTAEKSVSFANRKKHPQNRK